MDLNVLTYTNEQRKDLKRKFSQRSGNTTEYPYSPAHSTFFQEFPTHCANLWGRDDEKTRQERKGVVGEKEKNGCFFFHVDLSSSTKQRLEQNRKAGRMHNPHDSLQG